MMTRTVLILFCTSILSGWSFSATAFDPGEAMAWGGEIHSPDECRNEDTSAVAKGEGFLECIRYFGFGLKNEEANTQVVVVMGGDRDSSLNKLPQHIEGNTPTQRLQLARKVGTLVGAPVILLSRPGIYGSTGDHRNKRTLKEFLPISAALDTLKHRYGVQRWVIVGHSGGGTAAAALLTLGRSDVDCVVVTSGAFDLVERANRYRQSKGLKMKPFTDLTGTVNPYDPLYGLDGVPKDSARTVIVLGDPRDQVTPFEFQLRFADGLKARGHKVRVVEVEATPPKYHDLMSGVAWTSAKSCVAPKVRN